MEYIIASLVAILITTLIVYKVANNLFGLGLRFKPLLLCAMCAMFISLVLPKIVVKFTGLPGTLAVLAIFAVVFAYFVARCDNESLQQKEIASGAENACCLSEPLRQPEMSDKMTDQDISPSEVTLVEQQLNQNKVVVTQLTTAASKETTVAEPEQSCALENSGAEKEVPAEQSFVQEAGDSDALAVLPVIESDLLEETASTVLLTENTACSEDPMVDQQPMDHQDTVADTQLTTTAFEEITVAEPEFEQSFALEDSSAEKEIEELPNPSQNSTEVSQQMPDVTTGEDVMVQEQLSAEQSFVQEADDSKVKFSEPTVEHMQFKSEQLDDLIDFAFLCKENEDYDTAFYTFKKALALYPTSEASPFLVVEIGNILRNKGDYDEAIKLFLYGRNLSQTKKDEMMEQEFISTIAYLRITQNMLLQNRLGTIPFPEIPPQIIEQIDEEFQEWRSVGNI